MSRMKKLAITSAVVLALGLAGCTSGTAKQADSKSLKVVATTTQICDYTKQIAKDKVKLTCLLAPNASAHELEPTNEQMKALSEADLLLVNGVDLERFLTQAIKASGFKGKTIVTSKGVKTNKWQFKGENGQPPEFKFDPHVWTSPVNAKIQVENITKTLAEADKTNAKDYEKNGEGYATQIASLDKWAEKSIDSIPADERILFTSHDAFGYFSQRYGIKFLGAAIPDFSDLGEATAQHLQETVDKIKESKAKVIFAENSNSDKNVKTLAKEANVKVAKEEDALYGDSLGPKGSNGETYIGSIIHNVRSFVLNTGGKVAPLPDDLKAFSKIK